ncbi:hypothetical protein EUX98_g7437 [Antrodiella citrinella]|uniref:Peptidase A1 domain-containing protein n=1 Tax=Antrodiella citrinella TaxID=2447956 RepID=A0A4S4MTW0_9APHY|nr:hypothetical protein EUX98_g7437 [Antrodiella citrinella]
MLTIAYVFFAFHLLASASPSPVDRKSEGVAIGLTKRQDSVVNGFADLDALIQSVLRVRSKYENTIEAYRRNTGQEPPISLGTIFDMDSPSNSSSSRRATGAEPLTDQNEVLWQGQISVGTPPVTYIVDFDTGSSDLFLPGSSCTSNCAGHKLYDPTLSTASADRHKKFSLAYGDGSSVSGEQYTDTVTVAGLPATKQALGAANTYSDGFAKSNFPPDGLLGMGFQTISQFNAPPFMQTLIAQKQTTKPVFAFQLTPNAPELFLGGTNTNLYTGPITYVSVTTQGYWQVTMDSVLIGKTTAVTSTKAIIDTGTTLIIGDASKVQRFYSRIPKYQYIGNGFYSIPCNAIPTVSLTFGGKSFAIPPSVFNLGQVSAGSPNCVGAIVSSGTTSDFWIIGDSFLTTVYSIFDIGGSRVGFAALKS